MLQPTPELHATASGPLKVHPPPQLASISPGLRGAYLPAPAGIDSNLLIMFHGLGKHAQASFSLLLQGFA